MISPHSRLVFLLLSVVGTGTVCVPYKEEDAVRIIHIPFLEEPFSVAACLDMERRLWPR